MFLVSTTGITTATTWTTTRPTPMITTTTIFLGCDSIEINLVYWFIKNCTILVKLEDKENLWKFCFENLSKLKTRLISIVSQPIKVVVFVVPLLAVVVDPRNLPLKFDQNWVSNRWNIAFVVILVVVVVDDDDVVILSQQPSILLLFLLLFLLLLLSLLLLFMLLLLIPETYL